MTKLNLVIDTSLRQGSHCDFAYSFEKININQYSMVQLKSLYIHHENDVNKIFNDQQETEVNRTFLKPLHVHCSLLNKDYNFFNSKKIRCSSSYLSACIRTSERSSDFCT